MALPRFIGLKSNFNHKYLRYINEDVEAHGFVQFSGEEIVSPNVKFQVELAKSGSGNLVHIRCCYNNKYLVRWSSDQLWIVAGADEPNEDQSIWSCTLFEPLYVQGTTNDGDAQTLRFRHVQLGHYACLWGSAPPQEVCLYAGSADINKERCDVYTIINWESLLILPKHVAFKGDNGKYLACTPPGYPHLRFTSSDIGDETVGNEVFTTHDGSIHIKSDFSGKFWIYNPNGILAYEDDGTSNDPDTLFWPIKVEDNIIALRNLGSSKFCRRLNDEDDRLSASVTTITIEARLQVDETVLSRRIYNANFRLMDARIYNKSVLTMANADVTNNTQEPNTVDIKLSYTETRTSTWTASVSMKLGVKISFEAGVPFIEKGKIEVSAEVNSAYQWGETITSTSVVETVYRVTVPPMTRVKVSLLATKGSCDVPFSYTQQDTLTNGKQVTYNMDDGVYTGVNCFNFKYEAQQEPLSIVEIIQYSRSTTSSIPSTEVI